METRRKFPHKIGEIPVELEEKWARLQPVRVKSAFESETYNVSKLYGNAAEAIYNFKVRPDDVWVTSFPRSGTTLTQEMVWLIVNNDYETAKSVPLIKRFPFFEMNTAFSDEHFETLKESLSHDQEKLQRFLDVMSPQWVALEKKPGRRFIKTHLPFALLPPELLTSGCKVLYVARNPKDVAVSFFKFFYNNLPDEDFAEFWDLFQSDSFCFGPYWNHVIQGWKRRYNENYFFILYEDMVKDIKGTIKKVAAFLEKDMTEEQVDRLAEHMNIKNFRNNKSITRIQAYYLRGSDERDIVRKGEIGGWKNYFTDDLNTKANTWIEKNYEKTDLRFPATLE